MVHNVNMGVKEKGGGKTLWNNREKKILGRENDKRKTRKEGNS